MTTAGLDRLSPWSRGEDEGEGFERIRPKSILTLTLPLSLRKGRGDQKRIRNARISKLT